MSWCQHFRQSAWQAPPQRVQSALRHLNRRTTDIEFSVDRVCPASAVPSQEALQAAGKGDAAASLQLHVFKWLGGSKSIVDGVCRLPPQGALQELQLGAHPCESHLHYLIWRQHSSALHCEEKLILQPSREPLGLCREVD